MTEKRKTPSRNAPTPAEASPEHHSKCFVITPIGEEASAERRRANGLYEAVLRPTLAELGYSVKAAHHIASIGSITEQVIASVLHCDLVVADLSGLNPNVMYELAVRHSTGRPVIVLADDTTNLPFDIKQERTIFYHDDFSGVIALREALIRAVKDLNPGDAPCDNPVTRVSKARVLDPSTEVAPADEVILERLDLLATQMASLSRRQRQSTIPRVWVSKDEALNSRELEATFAMNGEPFELLLRLLARTGVRIKSRSLENGGDTVRLQLVLSIDSSHNFPEISDTIDGALAGTKIRLMSLL